MVQAVGQVAALFGHVVRFVLLLVSAIPYAAGPLLIIYGAWSIYHPAGIIVAGVLTMIIMALPRKVKR